MNQFYTLAFSMAFQTPLLCLIFCIFVFVTIGRNGMTRLQHFLLKTYAIATILLMAVEILSGLFMYDIFGASPKIQTWLLVVAYTIMLLIAIIWCEYCLAKSHNPSPLLTGIIRTGYFFVFVAITARIAFMNSKLFIYFEDSTAKYGPLDDVQSYGCVLLYFLLLILLIMKISDKNQFAHKEGYGKLIFATSTILISSLLYLFTWIPYLGLMGHTMVLLYIYQGSQSSIIYSDELTHLSNRRHMLKTIDAKIKDNSNWSYLIFDVNFFKQINDTYGHSEGDHALEIIASVLKNVASQNESSAFRYGGDEFVLIHDTNDEEKVRNICSEIDACFAAFNKEEKLPYLLSVSGGYAIYGENDIITIPDIMELADQRMYEDKQRKKAKRKE